LKESAYKVLTDL